MRERESIKTGSENIKSRVLKAEMENYCVKISILGKIMFYCFNCSSGPHFTVAANK